MKINPMQAAFVRFLSQFHVAAYRLSGGWGPLNRNTLILTTRGRKSGREISKPLLYFEDQGRIYLVASYGGNDSPPAWYLNLVQEPRSQGRSRALDTELPGPHADGARGQTDLARGCSRSIPPTQSIKRKPRGRSRSWNWPRPSVI